MQQLEPHIVAPAAAATDRLHRSSACFCCSILAGGAGPIRQPGQAADGELWASARPPACPNRVPCCRSCLQEFEEAYGLFNWKAYNERFDVSGAAGAAVQISFPHSSLLLAR